MAELDVLIKDGIVVDGTGAQRYRADVGMRDGRIAALGRLRASDARRVLDASGMIVAPGFIDLHTHYDAQLFWDPYLTLSGWHGVTSVVIGNCGFGFAPCKPEDRDRAMLSLSRNEAVPLATMRQGMPWDWVTFEEFLASVERTPKGVNVMSFVPLAPLYGYVVGVDEAKERRVTDEELEQMCALLVEGMRIGGCGISVQVLGEIGNVQLDYDGTPMVTDMMTEREVAAFSRALGSLGRGVAQMTGPLETAAFMARESGRPIIWNALLG
jgi:N-acyl-D-amino-acid deacylase